MRTLLELRDDEQNNRVAHCDGTEYKPKMFIAMCFIEAPIIFNGWFLDPFMNTIVTKDMPDKCVHFTDVELSKFQADFV